MHYVIIGNSAAAIGGVEGIRRVDPEGSITLITDEPYHTYSRPLISYYLGGKVKEEKMAYRRETFYEENRVNARLGMKAVSIDTAGQKVILEKGERVAFDRLLIATGGSPSLPPLAGLDKEGVFTFLKLDEAKRISQRVQRGTKAVIMGAGLIGLKAAEPLLQRGAQVTVVVRSGQVLSSILDKDGAALVQQSLEGHGLRFYFNNDVKEIRGEGEVTGVVLESGEELPCDLLIVARGVVPNTQLVQGTPIRVNRGIVVDETMATTVAHIYAAGDVAEGYDLLAGKHQVIPVLPIAYQQGETAGINMAGRPTPYTGGFALNAIGFFDFPMITAGIFRPQEPGYEELILARPELKIYKKLVLKDGKLVGFIFINRIDRAGILTGLIADRISVEEFKDKLLEDELGFIAFPQELREKKLEGGVA